MRGSWGPEGSPGNPVAPVHRPPGTHLATCAGQPQASWPPTGQVSAVSYGVCRASAGHEVFPSTETSTPRDLLRLPAADTYRVRAVQCRVGNVGVVPPYDPRIRSARPPPALGPGAACALSGLEAPRWPQRPGARGASRGKIDAIVAGRAPYPGAVAWLLRGATSRSRGASYKYGCPGTVRHSGNLGPTWGCPDKGGTDGRPG